MILFCNKVGIFLFGLTILTQGCTTYKVLLSNISLTSNLEGVYSNISYFDSINKRKTTLWRILDQKNEVQTDSISVRLDIIDTKSIKVSFLDKNKLIKEKVIKGKTKEDKCFYTRRRFYIIPILPVLWFFSNEQKRIYRLDNTLVVEVTSNSGGAVIIMAGGNKSDDVWRFNYLK